MFDRGIISISKKNTSSINLIIYWKFIIIFLLVYLLIYSFMLNFCAENSLKNLRVFSETAYTILLCFHRTLLYAFGKNASICPRNGTGKTFPLPVEMQLTKQPRFSLVPCEHMGWQCRVHERVSLSLSTWDDSTVCMCCSVLAWSLYAELLKVPQPCASRGPGYVTGVQPRFLGAGHWQKVLI